MKVRANAWMSIRHALYKPTSVHYANTFDVQLEHLKSVTREDLEAFHKKQFTPANAVLSFVGDIKTDEVINLAAARIRILTKAVRKTPFQLTNPASIALSLGRRLVSNLADKTNMDVVIGWPDSRIHQVQRLLCRRQ